MSNVNDPIETVDTLRNLASSSAPESAPESASALATGVHDTTASMRNGSAPSSKQTPQEWVCRPGEFARLPERPYQELWFELRTWGWKSLAIVPTRPGTSEFDVAERLVVVGVSNTNRPMSLISAEGVTVADTDRTIAMIRAAEARGERVVVVADSIHDNPASAPVIRAVNGTVLVVHLGDSGHREVEKTVNAIGRNRVIGVVTREN